MTFCSVYSAKLTDKQVRKIFVQKRYVERVSCSKCSGKGIFWLTDKKFRCKDCWSFSSLTKNTWLENSKIPLRVWYEIIWCFALSHSVSKLVKLLNLNYKSSFGCYQIIRLALTQRSFEDRRKIAGPAEVDESYYGGLFKNLRKEIRWKLRYEGKAKRGRGAKYRKQPVFGIYKRNGTVYLELITECTKKELEKIIERKIKKRTSIFSDTLTSYNGLIGLGYIHKTVNHGAEIYVDGKVRINGMEGFWGLSKTNMHTYKGIRKENWIYYLKEMEFRYNERHLSFEEMVAKIITILMTHRK
ncbi:IS1595 family transposase [Patescibacteria group bacterium]|nr:IS1595 family transposase [Patescibacteria group bacterium]